MRSANSSVKWLKSPNKFGLMINSPNSLLSRAASTSPKPSPSISPAGSRVSPMLSPKKSPSPNEIPEDSEFLLSPSSSSKKSQSSAATGELISNERSPILDGRQLGTAKRSKEAGNATENQLRITENTENQRLTGKSSTTARVKKTAFINDVELASSSSSSLLSSRRSSLLTKRRGAEFHAKTEKRNLTSGKALAAARETQIPKRAKTTTFQEVINNVNPFNERQYVGNLPRKRMALRFAYSVLIVYFVVVFIYRAWVVVESSSSISEVYFTRYLGEYEANKKSVPAREELFGSEQMDADGKDAHDHSHAHDDNGAPSRKWNGLQRFVKRRFLEDERVRVDEFAKLCTGLSAGENFENSINEVFRSSDEAIIQEGGRSHRIGSDAYLRKVNNHSIKLSKSDTSSDKGQAFQSEEEFFTTVSDADAETQVLCLLQGILERQDEHRVLEENHLMTSMFIGGSSGYVTDKTANRKGRKLLMNEEAHANSGPNIYKMTNRKNGHAHSPSAHYSVYKNFQHLWYYLEPVLLTLLPEAGVECMVLFSHDNLAASLAHAHAWRRRHRMSAISKNRKGSSSSSEISDSDDQSFNQAMGLKDMAHFDDHVNASVTDEIAVYKMVLDRLPVEKLRLAQEMQKKFVKDDNLLLAKTAARMIHLESLEENELKKLFPHNSIEEVTTYASAANRNLEHAVDIDSDEYFDDYGDDDTTNFQRSDQSSSLYQGGAGTGSKHTNSHNSPSSNPCGSSNADDDEDGGSCWGSSASDSGRFTGSEIDDRLHISSQLGEEIKWGTESNSKRATNGERYDSTVKARATSIIEDADQHLEKDDVGSFSQLLTLSSLRELIFDSYAAEDGKLYLHLRDRAIASLVLIFIIIAITLAFEALEHWLSHQFKTQEMQHCWSALSEELTVVGFLALSVTLLLQQGSVAKFLQKLLLSSDDFFGVSSDMWGRVQTHDPREAHEVSEIVAMFESLHVEIAFIMIGYITCVFLMCITFDRNAIIWEKMEKAHIFGSMKDDKENEEDQENEDEDNSDDEILTHALTLPSRINEEDETEDDDDDDENSNSDASSEKHSDDEIISEFEKVTNSAQLRNLAGGSPEVTAVVIASNRSSIKSNNSDEIDGDNDGFVQNLNPSESKNLLSRKKSSKKKRSRLLRRSNNDDNPYKNVPKNYETLQYHYFKGAMFHPLIGHAHPLMQDIPYRRFHFHKYLRTCLMMNVERALHIPLMGLVILFLPFFWYSANEMEGAQAEMVGGEYGHQRQTAFNAVLLSLNFWVLVYVFYMKKNFYGAVKEELCPGYLAKDLVFALRKVLRKEQRAVPPELMPPALKKMLYVQSEKNSVHNARLRKASNANCAQNGTIKDVNEENDDFFGSGNSHNPHETNDRSDLSIKMLMRVFNSNIGTVVGKNKYRFEQFLKIMLFLAVAFMRNVIKAGWTSFMILFVEEDHSSHGHGHGDHGHGSHDDHGSSHDANLKSSGFLAASSDASSHGSSHAHDVNHLDVIASAHGVDGGYCAFYEKNIWVLVQFLIVIFFCLPAVHLILKVIPEILAMYTLITAAGCSADTKALAVVIEESKREHANFLPHLTTKMQTFVLRFLLREDYLKDYNRRGQNADEESDSSDELMTSDESSESGSLKSSEFSRDEELEIVDEVEKSDSEKEETSANLQLQNRIVPETATNLLISPNLTRGGSSHDLEAGAISPLIIVNDSLTPVISKIEVGNEGSADVSPENLEVRHSTYSVSLKDDSSGIIFCIIIVLLCILYCIIISEKFF